MVSRHRPMNESIIVMTPGPMTAMNSVGRMQNISGKRIFTGTFWAFSSARWRRLTRISCDCMRSTWPMGIPNASACTIAVTNDRSSGMWVRSPSARIASVRPMPMCISCSTRANSVGQRARRCSWRPASQRGVEGQPGLDGDGQQVEGVGQLLLHLLGAVVAQLVDVEVRRDEAEQAQPDADDRAVGRSPAPSSIVQRDAEQQHAGEAERP